MRAPLMTAILLFVCAAFAQDPGAERVPAKFQLKSIVVRNATVIETASIDAVTRKWRDQWIGGFELLAIQRDLNLIYEERGYKGSGVVLGDQAIERGEVVFHAREVKVEKVEFNPPLRWIRGWVLSRQIWPSADEPLNLPRLQDRLTLLRDSPQVARVDAELSIGETNPAAATLALKVEEPLPFYAWANAANNRNPGIGAVRREVGAGHRSLLGFGDALEAKWGRTEGLSDSFVSYLLPVPATRFSVGFSRSKGDSRAIEPRVFKDLDILAVSDTRSASMNASLIRQPAHTLAVGISVDRKTSTTSLLGIPFSFTAGIADGESTIHARRALLDYAFRGPFSNASLRLIATRGQLRPVVDTGLAGAVAPDYRLLQVGATYAHSLFDNQLTLQARLDAQTSRQVLAPTERLSFGGINAVRGYRENLFLRDHGAILRLEAGSRPYELAGFATVSAAVFLDTGHGRNVFSRDDGLPNRISSIGISTEWRVLRYLRFNAAFAQPQNRSFKSAGNLQDRGIHLAVTVSYPAAM